MSEIPLDQAAGDVIAAAHDAARGKVVYLTEHGERLSNDVAPSIVAKFGPAPGWLGAQLAHSKGGSRYSTSIWDASAKSSSKGARRATACMLDGRLPTVIGTVGTDSLMYGPCHMVQS